MKQVNRYCHFRPLLLTALLLATLVSCSKQEQEPLSPSGDGVIRLNAVVADADGTKAPVIDGGAGAKATLANIHFLRKDGTTAQTNFGGVTALSGSRNASGAITISTAPTYAKSDANAWFVAYHPTTAPEGATVTAGSKVVWAINGKADILLSTLNAAQSYDAGKYSAPTTGTMTFKHALAQLEVICKAMPTTNVAADLVQSVWGNITKIELLTSPGDMTYTYATNALTYGAAAAKPLLYKDYTSAFFPVAIPANNSSVVTAAGMFAPSTGIIRLKVYSVNFPDGIMIPVQLKNSSDVACNFEAGKRYTVTLTFGADDKNIEVKSTIADWNAGYTAENNPNWGGPRIGSYYYTDGTISWDVVAGKTIEGVIFWVDPADPLHFKLAALKEPSASWSGGTNTVGKLQMSTTQTAIVDIYPDIACGLTVDDAARKSGRANQSIFRDYWATNTLGNTIETFPAVNWSEKMKVGGCGDWYLPSVDELQHLYCAYSGNPPSTWVGSNVAGPAIKTGYPTAFNDRFTAASVAGAALRADWHSSSSYADNSTVHIINFGDNGKANSASATSFNAIRSIKEIPVRALPGPPAPPAPPSTGVLNARYPRIIMSGTIQSHGNVSLTSGKSSYYGYTYNASNANNNGGYFSSNIVKEPVYYKLEVALTDESGPANTNGWDAAGKMALWATAWDACKAKAPTGEWRLPRMSELAWMAFNLTELEKTPDFTPVVNNAYWGGSEYLNTQSWVLHLVAKNPTAQYKATARYYVRCVRELK